MQNLVISTAHCFPRKPCTWHACCQTSSQATLRSLTTQPGYKPTTHLLYQERDSNELLHQIFDHVHKMTKNDAKW